MNDQTEIRIGYGIFNPSIKEQLETQGLRFGDGAEGDRLEKYRHAIKQLEIGDILTSSQAHIATERLHKRVMKSIEANNG